MGETTHTNVGGRHELIESAKVLPTDANPKPINVGLDTNHNIFFLADDGSDGKFGREIGLRSLFEKEMEETQYRSTTQNGTVEASQVFNTPVNIFSVLLHPSSWKMLSGINKNKNN